MAIVLPETPFNQSLASATARPAVHGGRAGVRVDGRQTVQVAHDWDILKAKEEGRRVGSWALDAKASLFLFAAEDGTPCIASVVCFDHSNLGRLLDDAVSEHDGRAANMNELAYFLVGGQDTRLPRSGSPAARLARLSALEETRAEVVNAVWASALPDNIREAFACLSDWPVHTAVGCVPGLTHPGLGSDRALAAANPLGYLVTRALNARWEEAYADARIRAFETRQAGEDEPAGEVPAPPALSPALLRRMAAYGAEAFADGATELDFQRFGQLASAVPVDWFPAAGDAEGIRAFTAAARLCAPAIELGLDTAALAHSAGGDWRAFDERCARAVGALTHSLPLGGNGNRGDAAKVVSWGLADGAKALARAILLPLAVRGGARIDPNAVLRDVLPKACGILYGGKSLPACLEAAVRWHAGLHALNAAMPSDLDDRTWEALHPTVRDGPYDVVALTSAAELMREGSPLPDGNGVPGMNHCIGGVGYRSAGATRTSHYVSVRLRDPGDGTPYARVATAEMRFVNGVLVARQVQGRGNAPASREAVAVVNRYMARPVEPVEPLYRDEGRDAVREQVGYDPFDDALLARAVQAWQPLLPRGWRGLTPEGIADKAGYDLPAAGMAPR